MEKQADGFAPLDLSSLPPPPVLPSQVLVNVAVVIQSFVRRKLVYKRVAKFRERAQVIKELALTENKYLVSLRISTSDYLHPLISKCCTEDEVLPADKIRVIFGPIEMVELLSKKLLVEFTKRSVRLNYWTRIGEVFLSHEKAMKVYSDYVQGYDAARKALGEALDAPKCMLGPFDVAVQKKHGTKLGIRDVLIMPVQRVPRYILLLRDILKKTDRGHPDFADLELAISKLQEFTVHMDAEAQRAESLRIIESKLAGDLKLLHAGGAGRRFLHEGPLVDASRQRKVYLFLFSDIVVVAKEPEAKGSGIAGISLRRGGAAAAAAEAMKMQIVDTMILSELSRCTNIKSFDQKTYDFKLDGTTYSCASDEERQIWIDHIHRVLREMRGRAAKSLADGGGSRPNLTSSLKAPSASNMSSSSLSGSGSMVKHRWAQGSHEFESVNSGSSKDASPGLAAKRGSASGFALGSRSRRAVSSAGDSAAVITTNPLLAAREHRQQRNRSSSSVLTSSAASESLPDDTATPPPPVNSSPALPPSPAPSPSAVRIPLEQDLPPPPIMPSPSPEEQQVKVKFAFAGSSEKEVTVEAGAVVVLLRALPSGWSVVRREDNVMGAVPTSYLEI